MKAGYVFTSLCLFVSLFTHLKSYERILMKFLVVWILFQLSSIGVTCFVRKGILWKCPQKIFLVRAEPVQSFQRGKVYDTVFFFSQTEHLWLCVMCSDQRITQDVDRMTKTFSTIFADLLISPFTIAFYTFRTWTRCLFIGQFSCIILSIFALCCWPFDVI